MSMFEVPKMASHPLDKFRSATIDYITGSDISLSGNLYVKGDISGSVNMGNDTIKVAYITGSQESLSGNLFVAGKISGSSTISGASFQGALVTGIIGSGSVVLLGQVTITTGAGLNLTQSGNTITIALA